MTYIGKITTTDGLKNRQSLLDELGMMRVSCARLSEQLVAAQYLLRHCRDLLAVIHGDGGHYTEEHGVEKSCADAIEKVGALRVALGDGLRAESARLQARLDRAEGILRQMTPGRPMAAFDWARAAQEYFQDYEEKAP